MRDLFFCLRRLMIRLWEATYNHSIRFLDRSFYETATILYEDRFKFSLRADFLNLFNRVNFGQP